MGDLRFRYRKKNGEESERTLQNWREEGFYVTGFCVEKGKIQTFRKDRVLHYHDNGSSFLRESHPAPPSREKVKDERWEVWFTCFTDKRKEEIRAYAAEMGFKPVASQTQALKILCVGPVRPGRAFTKTRLARESHAYIVSEDAFINFAETAELPDDEDFLAVSVS